MFNFSQSKSGLRYVDSVPPVYVQFHVSSYLMTHSRELVQAISVRVPLLPIYIPYLSYPLWKDHSAHLGDDSVSLSSHVASLRDLSDLQLKEALSESLSALPGGSLKEELTGDFEKYFQELKR